MDKKAPNPSKLLIVIGGLLWSISSIGTIFLGSFLVSKEILGVVLFPFTLLIFLIAPLAFATGSILLSVGIKESAGFPTRPKVLLMVIINLITVGSLAWVYYWWI